MPTLYLQPSIFHSTFHHYYLGENDRSYWNCIVYSVEAMLTQCLEAQPRPEFTGLRERRTETGRNIDGDRGGKRQRGTCFHSFSVSSLGAEVVFVKVWERDMAQGRERSTIPAVCGPSEIRGQGWLSTIHKCSTYTTVPQHSSPDCRPLGTYGPAPTPCPAQEHWICWQGSEFTDCRVTEIEQDTQNRQTAISSSG